MRDQFVGDIGDFGKYGLLRAISKTDSRGSGLSLGIVWLFVPDRMVTYLNDRGSFEACDPELFVVLTGVVEGCQRKVATIEESGLFPCGTVFFNEPVPPQIQNRVIWREQALEETEACDVIFFDPDNGLAAEAATEKASPKHVYVDDLAPFLRRGQAHVIYHHLGRVKHDADMRNQASELKDSLGLASMPWILRWHRVAPRAYFIVPNGRETELAPKVDTFLAGSWGQHFELQ